MILIAKKQRLARQSAKTLINFENIVVDTDFGGALSFRSMDGAGRANLSGDPDDIVVEMAQFDKDDKEGKTETNKTRLRGGKINGGLSGATAGSNRISRTGSGGP